jgi:hypothetical protein
MGQTKSVRSKCLFHGGHHGLSRPVPAIHLLSSSPKGSRHPAFPFQHTRLLYTTNATHPARPPFRCQTRSRAGSSSPPAGRSDRPGNCAPPSRLCSPRIRPCFPHRSGTLKIYAFTVEPTLPSVGNREDLSPPSPKWVRPAGRTKRKGAASGRPLLLQRTLSDQRRCRQSG